MFYIDKITPYLNYRVYLAKDDELWHTDGEEYMVFPEPDGSFRVENEDEEILADGLTEEEISAGVTRVAEERAIARAEDQAEQRSVWGEYDALAEQMANAGHPAWQD